jgi:hypothetical protein
MMKAAADDARRQQMKKKTLSVSGWFLGPIILINYDTYERSIELIGR